MPDEDVGRAEEQGGSLLARISNEFVTISSFGISRVMAGL